MYRFESEFPPIRTLRLKVETNCREHFSVIGYQQFPFEVQSSWYSGSCNITTYKLEELLGTKLRALYQRKKGRDLFDLHKALISTLTLNKQDLLNCYHEYMQFSVDHPPTQKQFILNMDAKMQEADFIGDITGLIRPSELVNQYEAYELVKKELIELI